MDIIYMVLGTRVYLIQVPKEMSNLDRYKFARERLGIMYENTSTPWGEVEFRHNVAMLN